MIQPPPETVIVKYTPVTCDGNGEHPRVWLHIAADSDWVECPYCDCRFILNNRRETL